jgi:hypothetical protein
MSYQQMTLFRCDGRRSGRQCLTEFQSWWIPLDAARDHAAENGWSSDGFSDYCPDHRLTAVEPLERWAEQQTVKRANT